MAPIGDSGSLEIFDTCRAWGVERRPLPCHRVFLSSMNDMHQQDIVCLDIMSSILSSYTGQWLSYVLLLKAPKLTLIFLQLAGGARGL